MRERVLKAIADRERRSSGSHVEGGEGTVLVLYEELLKVCPALGENRPRFGRR